MTGDAPSLFVWRGSTKFVDWRDGSVCASAEDKKRWAPEARVPELYAGYQAHCPFCRSAISIPSTDSFSISRGRCIMCGFEWKREYMVAVGGDADGESIRMALLRELSINDEDLSFEELGGHLRRCPDNRFYVSFDRMEGLVADIYRNEGWEVFQTQRTRDGGYDMVILGRDGQEILIEVKRYARTNKVHVGKVRQLLGVLLQEGKRRAKLITTSEFTSPAEQAAHKAFANSGVWMDLVDANGFLRLLQVYNPTLPPLHMDPRFIAQ